MKIARINHEGQPRWVEIVDDQIFALEGSPFDGRRGSSLGALEGGAFLAPIEPTNKIVGLMGNWGERSEKPGTGMIIKPMSSVIPHEADIVAPADMPRVNFEAELTVVIGRTARNVSIANANDYIFGYTIANDVTSFSVLHEDQIDFLGNLAAISMRFKMYDTFGPLGPWIITGLDSANLRLRTILNGKVVQDTHTSKMAYSVPEVVAWVSSVLTLQPGDVICTGTPMGFVDMEHNDVIECEIEGIGVLRNRFLRGC